MVVRLAAFHQDDLGEGIHFEAQTHHRKGIDVHHSETRRPDKNAFGFRLLSVLLTDTGGAECGIWPIVASEADEPSDEEDLSFGARSCGAEPGRGGSDARLMDRYAPSRPWRLPRFSPDLASSILHR